MSIIAKLLGRKKPTTANLSAELADKLAKKAEAEAKISAAQAARARARDNLDKTALAAADNDERDARQDLELIEHAVAALQQEHAKASAQEEREAFLQAVEDHRRAAARLTDRIKSEYPSAAAIIGKLVSDLSSFEKRDEDLRNEGKALGEPVNVEHPEKFRASDPSWNVTYPNPNGVGVLRTSAENAPWGVVRWVNGEPMPTHGDVSVWKKATPHYEPLRSIPSLPGLRGSDQPFHSQPEEPPVFFNPPG